MANWVSTRVIAYPTEGNGYEFQTLMDDVSWYVDDNKPWKAYFNDYLGSKYKAFFLNDPVWGKRKRVVTFSLYSGWNLPLAFLNCLVDHYRCRLTFVFSDETEGVYDVDYSSHGWFRQTGAAGVGAWSWDKDECFWHVPASDKDRHEMFLLAWNGERPVDGGFRYEDFFNQEDIDDEYFFDSSFKDGKFVPGCNRFGFLPRLEDWLNSRIEGEHR